MSKNYILTGPPRSGTTLACYLLNKLDNTVALHEPMNLTMFPDRETGLHNIRDFFQQMRNSLLTDGQAISKVKGQSVPDNPFAQNTGGKRTSIVEKKLVKFEKDINQDFHLIIKHNAHFSLLLNDLVKEYPCFCIIRNPLSVILSWNSIEAPVAYGRLNVLKTLDPEKYIKVEALTDVLDRQIQLLDILFASYLHLPGLNIIRYEDIIQSGGSALEVMIPDAKQLQETLTNRNRSPLYDKSKEDIILNKLLKYPGAWHTFYPPESITQP